MDRRDFVAGSMAAAAASLHWLRSTAALAAPTPAGPAASNPGANASTGPIVFDAVARAMLPFEDPRFAAITPGLVQRRAQTLFGLDRDPMIQSGLALFDELRLFQSPPPELLTAEAAYFPVDEAERRLPNFVASRQARDLKAYAPFYQRMAPRAALFRELHLGDARAYCMLWAHSALGMRRRFYQSVKSLVMAATYSMDEVWPVIGYAGPLLRFRSP